MKSTRFVSPTAIRPVAVLAHPSRIATCGPKTATFQSVPMRQRFLLASVDITQDRLPPSPQPVDNPMQTLWADRSLSLAFGRCISLRLNARTRALEVGYVCDPQSKLHWMSLDIVKNEPGFNAWHRGASWSQKRTR